MIMQEMNSSTDMAMWASNHQTRNLEVDFLYAGVKIWRIRHWDMIWFALLTKWSAAFYTTGSFFQGGGSSCNGLLLPKGDSESEESYENKSATNNCKEWTWKLKVHNLYVFRWTLLSGSFCDVLNYTLKSLFLLVLWQLYAGHAKHAYNWYIQAYSLSWRPWRYRLSWMTSEILLPPVLADSLSLWVFW